MSTLICTLKAMFQDSLPRNSASGYFFFLFEDQIGAVASYQFPFGIRANFNN